MILSTGGGGGRVGPEGEHGWGGAWHAWQGGMHGGGACVTGGMCGRGGMCGWGHVWRDMHDRECVRQGTCVIGGVCDTHAPQADTTAMAYGQ